MRWVATPEKDTATVALEKRLWDAVDQIRTKSGLRVHEYFGLIFGLVFLRFAEARFDARRAEFEKAGTSAGSGSRVDDPRAYQVEGDLYLSPAARFHYLLTLPSAHELGERVNVAMQEIEKNNPHLSRVLPKTYNRLTGTLLQELLHKISEISRNSDIPAFGRIYEYFFGELARIEVQKEGDLYTPTSIAQLLAEILEPFHGQILDPACGSGGMFVQSARFVANHQKKPAAELAFYGIEKTEETGRICRLNLAVHGLEGDVRYGNFNSYYDDPHRALGRFDFVLANPPFNVNVGDKNGLWQQAGLGGRFPFGLPNANNSNYLWIQIFYSALNTKGRAGFVMTSSVSDARASEQEIRKELIKSRAVDVMVAIGPNRFYGVKLPCTLWFLDKGKAKTPRADTVLFLDASAIYSKLNRGPRGLTPSQISFLVNLVRLYRGKAIDLTIEGDETKAKLEKLFGKNPKYQDVPGLCRVATLTEIEAQGWSLNPSRYVGVATGEELSDEFRRQSKAHPKAKGLEAETRSIRAIFLSSTTEDLKPYREAARDVVLDLGWHPVMMEHFGTDGGRGIVEACRERVARCDLLVAILGWRLGWVPESDAGGDGKRSITQIEIDTAKELSKPVVFLLARDTWPGNLWESDAKARQMVSSFRKKVDRLAVFIDWETVEVGGAETLPHFQAKVRQELLRHASPQALVTDLPLIPVPRFPNEQVQRLSEALTAAYERERTLVTSGGDPTVVRDEILDLRRKLREGGTLKAGDILSGRFQLIEPLGKGGFATVWKAFDLERRTLVAVKVLHGQYAEDRSRRERFFRGARKMAELHHQGIVRVIKDQIDDGGYHFFVMEFLPGGDLREAVIEGRLPTGRIVSLIHRVAEALSFAHARGVIHRDVKPANILLDGERHTKLTDFDLVQAADSTGGTRTGAVLGTFLYAAPECMSAPHSAGPQADVYSLAMTAVFCFHGRELPYDVLRSAETFISNLPCPPGVRAALRQGTEWEIEDRFPSVAALANAIQVGLVEPGDVS